MGIFDFVKGVGKKLGIGGDDEAPPNADTLKKELDSHKLGTDGVEVAVQGDTAVLKGTVKDQSVFEKAVRFRPPCSSSGYFRSSTFTPRVCSAPAKERTSERTGSSGPPPAMIVVGAAERSTSSSDGKRSVPRLFAM